MKFIILALLVAGGTAQNAAAAPLGQAPGLHAPGLQGHIQPAQYFDDWRQRQFYRREAFEHHRPRHVERHWRHNDYGRGYGHGYAPPHGRQFRQQGSHW